MRVRWFPRASQRKNARARRDDDWYRATAGVLAESFVLPVSRTARSVCATVGLQCLLQ